MDRNYIKYLIQTILLKEFKHPEKHKIVEYHDRFNYACPDCGDSKDVRKKRGNLYLNRLYHICFNCGSKTSLDKLCRKFTIQIDPQKKSEIYEYLNSQINVSDYQGDIEEFDSEKLFKLSDITRIFSDRDYSISDFSPVIDEGFVSKYLAERGITGKMLSNIFQAKYWISETDNILVSCF